MATSTASEASLEFTPTWVVALVCLIIVFISLAVERLLHHIGKCLKRNDQDALFEALQKLKEELMLLGFISLLLTVSQGPVSRICIPESVTNHMLPCKKEKPAPDLLLHYSQAVSPSTMRNGRRLLATVVGGADHSSSKYHLICSWYLWLFVVLFLLVNVEGWHTYFWMSFLPLILLLVVGAKLEHIITQLAEDISGNKPLDNAAATVKPSDKHFWFSRPGIVFYLIHFILFQNAFEIAFFFWIWSTYGFNSCILEKVGYIIPRLIIGVIVQVLCSYSTLPLYAIVTQMGSRFKPGIFEDHVKASLQLWHEGSAMRGRRSSIGTLNKNRSTIEMQKMESETFQRDDITECTPATLEGIVTQITEVPDPNQNELSE